MTAIVLPDIDRSTIEELRKKIPNLSEIELPQMPSMEKVGKTADDTIDRLLGRQKAPVWPWIAAGIGLVAVIGAVAAYFAWLRRPTWEASDAWSTSTTAKAVASEPPICRTSPQAFLLSKRRITASARVCSRCLKTASM